MSECDCHSININTIYPSSDSDSNIWYLKCDSSEDVSMITRNAKNLSELRPMNEDSRPSLVTHIPSSFFAHYQECEKLLFNIRDKNRGVYLTNIRLGKSDIIMRYKRKDDPTPWKNVPQIKSQSHSQSLTSSSTRRNISNP